MSAISTPPPTPEPPSSDKSSARQTAIGGLLTILGSTGVISVYGPIAGELYWSGFLSAFGLSSLEFPASESEVRVHAFSAVAIAVASLWSEFARALLIVAVVIIGVALIFVLKQLLPQRLKTWTRQKVMALVAWKDKRHDAAQAGFIVLFGIALCTVAMIFLSAAALVMVIPFYARSVGEEQGIAHLKKRLAQGALCMNVKADGFAFKCPHVIAYGKDTLGVLDGGQVHRVPRDKASVSSPLPVRKQP
jgi:hypothetical protein